MCFLQIGSENLRLDQTLVQYLWQDVCSVGFFARRLLSAFHIVVVVGVLFFFFLVLAVLMLNA